MQAVRSFIVGGDRRTVALALGGGLAATGVALGTALAFIGPVYTGILLLVIAASLWVINSLENALWGVIAIVLLLPYATLPFKIVLTPTFLDFAMGAVYFLYLMQWMTGERRRLATTPIHALIVLFMVLALFSFVAGLRYAGLTSTALRKFAELLLSISLSMVLVDICRTHEQIRRLVQIIILAGSAAALGAIVLWLMPDTLAERILIRLSVIGYPDGGVIQYIEQNPELPERAIGTSVNPNSLGGVLVMVAALAAPQLITSQPIFKNRWITAMLALPIVVCIILTFSRGSMLALGASLVIIAAVKYRRMLWIIGAIGLVLLILPWTQPYVERFAEGFQGQDLATQMRFGEYKDALTLIGRYPLLGVGFSGAPDVDLYLGVSNIYLTIAGNMGVVGLVAYLMMMTGLFAYAWSARRIAKTRPDVHAVWLGLLAGIAGMLATGIFDHYFFNLEFHHASTILWMFVGLLLASTRIVLAGNVPTKRSSSL